jgi:hypothetical protein
VANNRPRTQRSLRKADHRKANRYSEVGLDLELHVESLLEKMVEEEIIQSFTHHSHNSPEDSRGKDFTVSKVVCGEIIKKSFGVTISLRSWNHSKHKHPNVPQMCFPIGTKTETINKRILDLFNK